MYDLECGVCGLECGASGLSGAIDLRTRAIDLAAQASGLDPRAFDLTGPSGISIYFETKIDFESESTSRSRYY